MSKTYKPIKRIKTGAKSFFGDFKNFITKGNIIDLAIAVVIGAAFGKIVSSLVKDIFTPITGLLINTGDLATLKWVIKPAIEANEAAGIAAVPETAITYGVFLQNIIDFLIIGLVLFLVLRIVLKFKSAIEHKEIETAKVAAAAEEEKKKQAEAAAVVAAEQNESMRLKLYSDIAKQSEILAEIRDLLAKH